MEYDFVYVALIRRKDDGIWVAYAPDLPGESSDSYSVELGRTWTDVEYVINAYIKQNGLKLKHISPIATVIARARRYINNEGWDTDWLKDVKRIPLNL